MKLELFIRELYGGMFQLKLFWVVVVKTQTLHLQRLNKKGFYICS